MVTLLTLIMPQLINLAISPTSSAKSLEQNVIQVIL